MPHLERLYAHLAWADARAIEALRAMSTPDPDALGLLAHVLGAEHVWLSRIEQRPHTVAAWPALDLDACERLARENRRGFEEVIARAGPGDLARDVGYVNSAGDAFRSTLEDILLHVALHGAYHRGQVALLVRRAGAEPRATDYIAFVRGTAAATRDAVPIAR